MARGVIPFFSPAQYFAVKGLTKKIDALTRQLKKKQGKKRKKHRKKR
jgi:hypothetical protein